MIVLRRDHDYAIARLYPHTQGAHRFRCVLAIIILIVERYPVQREDFERSLGRKHFLKAAQHCGAVGGAAQTAGEAEKAEHLGPRLERTLQQCASTPASFDIPRRSPATKVFTSARTTKRFSFRVAQMLVRSCLHFADFVAFSALRKNRYGSAARAMTTSEPSAGSAKNSLATPCAATFSGLSLALRSPESWAARPSGPNPEERRKPCPKISDSVLSSCVF